MANTGQGSMTIDAQAIDAPLSRASIFLVVTVEPGDRALAGACAALDGLDDLVKTVSFRAPEARLSCVAAVGIDMWNRLLPAQRPLELKPFAPIAGAVHAAPSTPGDMLFHIRAERADICFEFERLLLNGLGESVKVADEVSGFRYFDARDLLGFVDGTANPVGGELPEATLVGDEDPEFAGGSYVVVQKYLHDMDAWARIPTPLQEEIIGRTKIDNVELDDDASPRKSHKTLATIVDETGEERDILRDNMPFGRPGQNEFGTYFIGYSRHLWVIEKMLTRMFIGDPPGAYDRLLDVSTAVTGATFFAPSRPAMARLVGAAPSPTEAG